MNSSPIAQTSLFYGVFLETVPILIAAKAHVNFINQYQSVLLQLSRFSDTRRSMSEVPVELWDRIKSELKALELKEWELDLLAKTYCECCISGVCMYPEEHSLDEKGFEEHIKPFGLSIEERMYRDCWDCRYDFGDYFRGHALESGTTFKVTYGPTEVCMLYLSLNLTPN